MGQKSEHYQQERRAADQARYYKRKRVGDGPSGLSNEAKGVAVWLNRCVCCSPVLAEEVVAAVPLEPLKALLAEAEAWTVSRRLGPLVFLTELVQRHPDLKAALGPLGMDVVER